MRVTTCLMCLRYQQRSGVRLRSVRHRIFDVAPNLASPWNNFELSSLRSP